MSPTTLAAMTETFTGKGDAHKNHSYKETIMMLPHQVVYTVYEDVVSAWSVVVSDMTINNSSNVSKQNVHYNSTDIRSVSNSSNYYKGKYECREWPIALPFGAPLHFACLSCHDTLMLMHLDDYNNNNNNTYDDMKRQNTALRITTTSTLDKGNIATNV